LIARTDGQARIVLPEGANPFIIEAAQRAEENGLCTPILLKGDDTLNRATEMLAAGEVDGMVAGIDHTTRDVILANKRAVGMSPDTKTFCSLFVMDFGERDPLILADGGVVCAPTAEQLADITLLTADAARTILPDEPRVAMLSFSTLGSGGDKDLSLIKVREALQVVHDKNPELKIDGEFQLDAAVNPRIGEKKAPDSPVAGRANVLITPDLHSGYILY
jgi:phosphate acetyltransferase